MLVGHADIHGRDDARLRLVGLFHVVQSQVPVDVFVLFLPDARRMPLTYSTLMIACFFCGGFV